jgi:hypothetical protein
MAQNDMIAFSRMKPQEKQEFISSNPDSPYNPHRSSKRYYWQLLCLTPPPGTEPHHIPRARGNSRFVPPAYAHQRSMSVRPLLYGHQHTYSNAPMSQPAYTAYTAPTHLGAPSAYEAPAYHDPYSSKTRDAPLPPLPREAQAPLASTSYKTANDEPDQPSVYGTAYEEFNIPPEHMRASPRSAMRAAQARPNSNVNMVNVPLGSHQPASYQNSAANMAANVPVQQQPPVPPQKSGRAPMTRPIHMSNQH